MSTTSQALLTALSAALPRDTLRVPDSRGNGQELRRYSILSRPLIEYFGGESKPDVFELARNETRDAVNAEAAASVATDRALGALVGLVIGDGVGAPLEFLPTRATPLSDDRPHLRVKPVKGNLEYVGEFNKFGLHRGQWTDDSSMALCLADSLLCRDGYNGSDCRTRYNMWWFQGYNNAFRFDSGSKHSCGLGGNIANSLEEVCAQEGKPSDSVPARFTAKGEDAGNGSIMRLGAVPVRYSYNPAKAIAVAMESSYATHPGPDAAACCAFLAFAVLRAIHRSTEPTTPAAFLDATIAEFMAAPNQGSDSTDTGFAKLAAVLTCKPPTPKEAVWDWKAETIAVAETVRARQPKYNGYPVSPGYFGSYCLDGLAMALWAFRGSTTFSDSIIRITNLLGDCDTTGAIAGQMTGAFYGYRAIPDRHSGEDDLEAPTMGQLFLSNMQRWDPLHEIQLRALLLHKAALAEAAPDAAAAAAAP